MNYLGDDYKDLFLEASSYAQRKIASERQPVQPDETMRWVFIGGAALSAIILLGLILRR